MTEVPDYVLPAGAPAQAVHTEPAKNYQWESLSQDQLNSIRQNLITSILQIVIQAITGIFIPGGGLGGATDQLTNWASGIPIIGDIVEALTGTFGGLDILGPLTGLFGPLIDLFDGTGSPTGAGSFTDNGDGTGTFDLGALGDLIDSGDGTGMSIAGLLGNLIGQLGTFQSTQTNQQNIIDTIFTAIRGGTTTGNQPNILFDALQNIPFLNVLGIGGPSNIGGSVSGTWDNLISGFVGVIGSGAGLPDLFNVGQEVSSNAAKGGFSWDILGIRNNRSLDRGLLPTSTSNMPLSRVAMQTSAPTFGVTQSTSTIAFDVVPESQAIGVVRWHGSGNSSITDFRVNIWKMDRITGAMTLVHNSANIISDIPATATPPPVVAYSLPTPIAALATECYGFELTVVGGGTHNVVGTPTWLANDTSTFPRNYAATRNSGTGSPPSTITAGSVTYATNVPFIEYGVSISAISTFHDPQTTLFNTSTTMPIPSWCEHVDIIALGAGGGGHQGGSIGIGGEGGDAGTWAETTWHRGTHFTSGTIISMTIGAGGSRGVGGNGGNGGATSVSIPGSTLTAPGGIGGNSLDLLGSNHAGDGPGTISYNTQPYAGGVDQNTYGSTGIAPGGGGAGGNWISFQPGGAGAAGAVWVRAYQ